MFALCSIIPEEISLLISGHAVSHHSVKKVIDTFFLSDHLLVWFSINFKNALIMPLGSVGLLKKFIPKK